MSMLFGGAICCKMQSMVLSGEKFSKKESLLWN